MRLIDSDVLIMKLASLDRVARSPAQKALLGRAMYIADHMPTVGGWISVEDKLPEQLCICLGYGCGEYNIVHTGNEGWLPPYLTHWMPLPEPPKEE